jgi:hypothetical protein
VARHTRQEEEGVHPIRPGRIRRVWDREELCRRLRLRQGSTRPVQAQEEQDYFVNPRCLYDDIRRRKGRD